MPEDLALFVSSERRRLAGDERPVAEPEWSLQCLEAFTIMPAGSLADYYFEMVDIDPAGDLPQTRQLAAVIEGRGLSDQDLHAAWTKLHAGEAV